MGNKEWDKYLNDLLGDYKPEGIQPNWEEFSNQLDTHQDLNEPADDPTFDENLKESFDTYKAPEQVVGWQRIQASLDTQDKQFDEDIRKRVADFKPHYNPRTWPLFLKRFSDSRFLAAKLILLKAAEVAAVLLILFTVFNMGRMGKLPFETPLHKQLSEELNNNPGSKRMAGHSTLLSSPKNNTGLGDNSSERQKDTPPNSSQQSVIELKNHPFKTKNITHNSSFVDHASTSGMPDDVKQQISLAYSENATVEKTESIMAAGRPDEEKPNIDFISGDYISNYSITNIEDIGTSYPDENLIAFAGVKSQNGATDYLTSLTSPVENQGHIIVLFQPSFIKQPHKSHAEFGILVQVDYNRLRMPEDKLYTTGRQIVFPQQGIPSYGYGGGFTMAAAHPRWAIESGLIYSSKTFEPGRKLAIGTAFDNGIVEFEAMHLQLVTMPIQFRYKLDNTGPIKFYTLAGFGLNLIVQSNIDVTIKYHFPSLSANENPNNNPNLANTIKETRRISEQFRDGAPFSTKSFLSATAGLGIEYSTDEHKIFFLQSAVQYQIPDLEFSNNNGKHIRSLSIQAGVRTPLGN